ncbi:MAG: nucleotidyltransferase domain-containing protein [Calditrichaeota bacterium]|nr:nucleotidyltransferase domain-containing protein [Calditrichota bacterium]MCB9369358.1 nucleotidyltransferase domain-containing protein [Calditrichota bacterium]
MKDIVLSELVNPAKLAEFCAKWKIVEFALFGSVLRDDFGPDSDIDVLVDFAPDSEWGLYELVDMEDELKVLFDRDVDLVLRRSIQRSKNRYSREHILGTARTVYVAG